jgi:hypothetical protein
MASAATATGVSSRSTRAVLATGDEGSMTALVAEQVDLAIDRGPTR